MNAETLFQLTGCKHSLDIVGNITENSSITLWMVWLRRQRFYLNTLNNRLMDMELCIIKNSAIANKLLAI